MQETNQEFAASFAAKCRRAYADELERLARAAVTAWLEKQEPYPAGNTIRVEMYALRDFLTPGEDDCTESSEIDP